MVTPTLVIFIFILIIGIFIYIKKEKEITKINLFISGIFEDNADEFINKSLSTSCPEVFIDPFDFLESEAYKLTAITQSYLKQYGYEYSFETIMKVIGNIMCSDDETSLSYRNEILDYYDNEKFEDYNSHESDNITAKTYLDEDINISKNPFDDSENKTINLFDQQDVKDIYN